MTYIRFATALHFSADSLKTLCGQWTSSRKTTTDAALWEATTDRCRICMNMYR